jgi:hypothetical protein
MGLGSEIRDPEKTYSGSRIRIRNTGTGSYLKVCLQGKMVSRRETQP